MHVCMCGSPAHWAWAVDIAHKENSAGYCWPGSMTPVSTWAWARLGSSSHYCETDSALADSLAYPRSWAARISCCGTGSISLATPSTRNHSAAGGFCSKTNLSPYLVHYIMHYWVAFNKYLCMYAFTECIAANIAGLVWMQYELQCVYMYVCMCMYCIGHTSPKVFSDGKLPLIMSYKEK